MDRRLAEPATRKAAGLPVAYSDTIGTLRAVLDGLTRLDDRPSGTGWFGTNQGTLEVTG